MERDILLERDHQNEEVVNNKEEIVKELLDYLYFFALFHEFVRLFDDNIRLCSKLLNLSLVLPLLKPEVRP